MSELADDNWPSPRTVGDADVGGPEGHDGATQRFQEHEDRGHDGGGDALSSASTALPDPSTYSRLRAPSTQQDVTAISLGELPDDDDARGCAVAATTPDDVSAPTASQSHDADSHANPSREELEDANRLMARQVAVLQKQVQILTDRIAALQPLGSPSLRTDDDRNRRPDPPGGGGASPQRDDGASPPVNRAHVWVQTEDMAPQAAAEATAVGLVDDPIQEAETAGLPSSATRTDADLSAAELLVLLKYDNQTLDDENKALRDLLQRLLLEHKSTEKALKQAMDTIRALRDELNQERAQRQDLVAEKAQEIEAMYNAVLLKREKDLDLSKARLLLVERTLTDLMTTTSLCAPSPIEAMADSLHATAQPKTATPIVITSAPSRGGVGPARFPTSAPFAATAMKASSLSTDLRRALFDDV